MGFRNPATTAAAVDTGSSAPGVRIYAQGSNPASGIVEWHAGGASPAQATFTASDTGSGGSSFALHGGDDLGVTAPMLALNVEELGPPGAHGPVARLTAGAGGQIILDGLVAFADDPAWLPYTPGWTCGGAAPSLGNGSLIGRYRRLGRLCFFHLTLTPGSSTTGGTSGMNFGLPFPSRSAPGEQFVTAKLFSGGFVWGGVGQIPSGSGAVQPFFPANGSTSSLGQLQNANTANTAGTGVPAISGSYTIPSGTNLVVCGAYETTATS